MRSFRFTAVIAAVVAVTVVLAGPASAAAATTKRQVVRSLLTATEVGSGWHLYDDSGSPSADVSGCTGTTQTTVGLKFSAKRAFQYSSNLLFAHEQIESFRTILAARKDFKKSLASFSSCTTLMVNGRPWTVARLSVPSYADQQAMFRLSGPVATAVGDVPVTMFLVATRWGHHEVVSMLTVGGQLTSTQRTEVKKAAVRLSKLATSKVAARLGR